MREAVRSFTEIRKHCVLNTSEASGFKFLSAIGSENSTCTTKNIFEFLEPIKIKDANRFSTNRSEMITLPGNKQKEATDRYTINFILHKSAIKRHLTKTQRNSG